jgi:hypothetical protein
LSQNSNDQAAFELFFNSLRRNQTELEASIIPSGDNHAMKAFGVTKVSPHYKSKEIGNASGEKYIATYKSWGRQPG